MKKRIITIDDFVYQIVLKDRVPRIIEREIQKITKSGEGTTNIIFGEDPLNSITGMVDSIVYYKFFCNL